MAATNTEIDPVTGLTSWPGARPFPVGAQTVPDLVDQLAVAAPERPALVDQQRSWSYGELRSTVVHTAAELSRRGVIAGDRVVWRLPNIAELPIGFLATAHLGAMFVGANPALAAPEVSTIVDDADPRLVLDTSAAIELVEAGEAAHDALEGLDAASVVDMHTPVAIAYTSGTTGRPKGAVHTHHNVLWQAAASLWTSPPIDIERHGTPLANTILNIFALGPLTAFSRVGVYVMLTDTTGSGHAADIAEHGLTHSIVVPPIVHDLVHDVAPDALSTLRQILVGGAGSPVGLREDFAAKFGMRVTNSYGLTETIAGVAREQTDQPMVADAVGVAREPVEISVVDGDGAAVAIDDVGEICVTAVDHGPWAHCWTPMLGYWRRPEETATALRHDRLHTGDLGSLDGHGRLTVRGRANTVIIRGGANIYPAEVEAALASHPDVVAAVAYGVDDDRLGQRVVAAAELTPDADATQDALIAHCRDQIARYKCPDVIEVVERLPRNAMGKILLTDLP